MENCQETDINANALAPNRYLRHKVAQFKKATGLDSTVTKTVKSEHKNIDVPNDIICYLCKDFLKSAVAIPCCAESFCEECNFLFIFTFIHTYKRYTFVLGYKPIDYCNVMFIEFQK